MQRRTALVGNHGPKLLSRPLLVHAYLFFGVLEAAVSMSLFFLVLV